MGPQLRIGRAFLPLFHNHDKFVLIESPRGCAKSTTILNVLMSRAARWPGKRWYIWRSTRSLLSTSILPSFEEYVLPVWRNVEGMRLMNPAARPTQRTEYVFENGSVFIPMGMDDMLRGTSAEGAGGYLAEAIELESREQVEALVGMMRQPGVPFHQIIVDVNPAAPAHWANEVAEPVEDGLRRVRTRGDYNRLEAHNWHAAAKGKWKRIVARIQDNPWYFDIDRWRLTEAGRTYLAGLAYLTGTLRRRWLDGEWVANTGSVFPMWDRGIHLIDDFEPPPEWVQVTAWDPGMNHPTGIPWITVAPDGAVIVYDEIWGSGKTVTEHGEEIIRREEQAGRNILRRFGDPQQFFSSTAAGNCNQQALAVGLKHIPWARAGRNKQGLINALADLLLATGKHERRPGEHYLQVCRRCRGTISNFENWKYKLMSDGTMREGDDAYVDADNDIVDGLAGVWGTGYLQRAWREAYREWYEPAALPGYQSVI